VNSYQLREKIFCLTANGRGLARILLEEVEYFLMGSGISYTVIRERLSVEGKDFLATDFPSRHSRDQKLLFKKYRITSCVQAD